MIIQLLEINPLATAINAMVEVSSGNTVVQALAWNVDTYKSKSQAVNLSHLLGGTDETESLVISSAELGVERITGLWAIEFSSSASPEFRGPQPLIEDPQLGIVANLIPYYECVLDKAQRVAVKNCQVVKTECGNSDSLLLASTLLDTLKDTLVFGLIDETVQILKTLNELCEVCTICPDYGQELVHAGYAYKTIDNVITIA